MKFLLTLALLTLATVAGAQIKRDLQPFTGLAVNAGITATVVASDRHRVEVTGDEAALRQLKIENEGGTLALGFEDGAYRRLSAAERNSVRATVYTPRLDRAIVNGGAKVSSEHVWASDDFKIVANGGAELSLALDVSDKLSIVANGGAEVRLSGNAAQLSLNVNGGSEVDASELHARSAEVMANGAAQASVRANDSLEAMANGNAEVIYTGDVTNADVRTNGGGSVRRG